MRNTYNETVERLSSPESGYYQSFDLDIVHGVAEVAARQASFDSYQRYFDYVGLPLTDIYRYQGRSKPIQLIDVRRSEEDGTLFVHLPMANPLDPNQLFQVATIADANREKRVIATGNPSGGGYRSGHLSWKQLRAVGNVLQPELGALVETEERYLDDPKHRVEAINHVGYSYGALKAAVAASRTYRQVESLTAIEPVIGKRTLVGLIFDFIKTDQALDRYVAAAQTPIYEAAKKDGIGMAGFVRGLGRLTNIAIGISLAKVDIEEHIETTLIRHDDAHATLAWGSDSELARDEGALALSSRLFKCYESRFRPVRLDGQRHALANDPHLHAALVTQGLRRLAHTDSH